MQTPESRSEEARPALDGRVAREHRERLDARYAARFTPAEIERHVRGLSTLGPDAAAVVQTRPLAAHARSPGAVPLEVTVLAFDHPGAFSAIVGVLSSMGFDINAGDVFTWAPPVAGTPNEIGLRRRRIVDCFTGAVPADAWDDAWTDRLDARLREVFGLLEAGGESAARARAIVNEMAAGALGELRSSGAAVLYPVRMDTGEAPRGRLRMRVLSQDTPFFLFTFSTALTLQELSIECVTIRTDGGRIEDEFEIADAAGRSLDDPARVDRIKLSVLVTKQFTSVLGDAPDPLAALQRFEQLLDDILALPRGGDWVRMLSAPAVLGGLAQLLGASTFLWEDFVRLQYEELLPLLAPHVAGARLVEPVETLPARLSAALAGAADTEDFARRLNAFKDREVYLYDLDHILGARPAGDGARPAGAGREGEARPAADGAEPDGFTWGFLLLSKRLTALAELVVDAAADRAVADLAARFGQPGTVAGLPVRHAILGLGKLGGAALGYASDVEIMLVYSDSGATAGPERIDNAEFYDRAVREILRLVHARREGIFHIDLRLRPYGAAGPLACGLESFCTYYGPGGPAHSYERLALVRLRAVGGDPELGRRMERLRDEMVYDARSIDQEELRALRARQAQEMAPRGLNAKFSPGALVDLEYAVQMLQARHGAAERRLRTPRIHEALAALASLGLEREASAQDLVDAYRFFRRLINGLRMLRGSARDLLLPEPGSDEYTHLARRIGYARDPRSPPAQRLRLDFEAHTAAVRAFVERHFGRESLPGAPRATVADLALSDSVPAPLARAVLAEHGFADPDRALVNLRRIGGGAERRTLFARLATLACDMLSRRPDPDMALNNWERFLHALPDPEAHLALMLSQPMRLEILLKLFSASQFLADALARDPGLMDWIARREVIHAARSGPEVAAALREISARNPGTEAWRDALRTFRRAEILRIGARDICLGIPTRRVMEELSDLADGVITAALERALAGEAARSPADAEPVRFCVVAFGKLGGRELNYSSDIDLMGVCAGGGAAGPEEPGTRIMKALREDLSAHTTEGYAYRVDLRLRPYGSAGQLVYTLAALAGYYSRSAAPWEIQALLKARPVAGDPDLGRDFLAAVRPLLLAARPAAEVAAGIERLRGQAMRGLSRGILETTDVKTGLGGIRDVEFLVQGMQLVHAHGNPGLLSGGTLPALTGLAEAGLMDRADAERLADDYLFLRRVEHFLQIYEDRQTHRLPSDPAQLRALARLMLGGGAAERQLLDALAERFTRVHAAYQAFVRGEDPG
jgi:[glutamine synthetase] adenylyltransferase / [glutamine synthetase]-adenylyl-L-tyrosine phosphorylase